jgi:hypothetical protein
MPGGGKSAALQRRVVAVEGGGFCVMVEKLNTLALKDLDVVLAQPVGGVGVAHPPRWPGVSCYVGTNT